MVTKTKPAAPSAAEQVQTVRGEINRLERAVIPAAKAALDEAYARLTVYEDDSGFGRNGSGTRARKDLYEAEELVASLRRVLPQLERLAAEERRQEAVANTPGPTPEQLAKIEAAFARAKPGHDRAAARLRGEHVSSQKPIPPPAAPPAELTPEEVLFVAEAKRELRRAGAL